MIEIASAAMPQLVFPSPLLARSSRRRSPKYAPSAYHHHVRPEKSDPIVDRQHPCATRHPSKSASMLVPTPHQYTPTTLKSP